MKEAYLVKIYCIFCVSLIFVIVSCSKQPSSEDFVNINYQYELKLHQELSDDGGIASLNIISLEPYICTNSYISHHTVISNDKMQLFLNDILTEGDCISGNEHVSEEILINTTNKSLPVEINLKNIVSNKGTLHTDNTEFDLRFDEFDGLKISKTHIIKVQKKMFWGSFSTSDSVVEQLLKDYISSIDLNYSKIKGDYGYFYVGQNNAVEIYNNQAESDFSFLVSTDEILIDILSKIQEFKELDSSLVFQATNYDGSTLNIQ